MTAEDFLEAHVTVNKPWAKGLNGIVRTVNEARTDHVWVYWAGSGTHTSHHIGELRIVR